MTAQVRRVETAGGIARVHVLRPRREEIGTLALGHGAGGGIEAPDLQALARAATVAGWRVALIEQPWRVAGRRVAAPPARLDEDWVTALAAVTGAPGGVGVGVGGRVGVGVGVAGAGAGAGPLVVGGRSAGARVACRTAASTGAAGICCLAFPLHPPGRPERSRASELAAAGVPLIVVQGVRDAFGRPDEVAAVVGAHRVRAVPGDHALKADPAAVAAAALAWLAEL